MKYEYKIILKKEIKGNKQTFFNDLGKQGFKALWKEDIYNSFSNEIIDTQYTFIRKID